jgi:hypothetical protein
MLTQGRCLDIFPKREQPEFVLLKQTHQDLHPHPKPTLTVIPEHSTEIYKRPWDSIKGVTTRSVIFRHVECIRNLYEIG